ncbi:MAG: hypothetical protein P4L33_13575 [Capsulimonadaceae bacterium]|nr:hypothetical protein [Capsulimonadaceae bacterium]
MLTTRRNRFRVVRCLMLAAIALDLFTPLPCFAAQLSRPQVIQLAKDFCKAVGMPASVSMKVLPPPLHRSTVKSHHWRPLWHVDTATGAILEIADVSGIVVGYEASPSSVQATKSAALPLPLGQDDIIRIATLVRDASGQKTELDESPQLTDTGASTGAARMWSVRWRRVWNGVPYRNDEAVIVVEGATGAVRSFTVNFSSPPPGSVEELTTAQEAMRIATDALSKSKPGESLTPLPPRKLVVAVPGPGASGASRVAWCCRFDGSSHQTYEALIDIESGNVLSSGLAPSDD